jgi:beta-glucosidase
MVDIARDPRWGRIAESPGEDPLLAERMAVAMVVGFQGDSLTASDSLAACVKHFAGYGAAEGGRDYNGAQISEALLRNVYLRPFAAALEAGAASVMTGFHEVNGVPATADPFLLRQVLREEWEFRGLVVSDWNSVTEMIAHGFAADAGEAARFSALAGVDLEMISRSFEEHLPELVARGLVPMNTLDQAVRNVLRVKQRLGLFQRPERDDKRDGKLQTASALALAREAARQSLVLVKNRGVLPLSDEQRIAVIGPLAEAPHEQLGTWAFDGRADTTQTPLSALRRRLGDNRVAFAPGLANSRTLSSDGFDAVIAAAESAETILFFGGEEAILSGEAHSRADLRLPGAQEELVQRLADLGKPLVLVVMSGRPNTLEALLESSDAVLIAWHPGTMGGPAIADVLFGDTSPSGRLPVTWPIDAGQIPIYYNHNNTGRPAPDTLQSFMDIPVGAWQSSLSNTSRYLDLGTRPRFPFGYGLTYGQFEYSDLSVSEKTVTREGSVRVTVLLRNVGSRSATEVVQLYSRDPVARLARPVRELRDFQRITLDPGQSQPVSFDLAVSDLAFYDGDGRLGVEPGRIDLFVGPNAQEGESASFEIIAVGDAKSTEVRRKMSDANK